MSDDDDTGGGKKKLAVIVSAVKKPVNMPLWGVLAIVVAAFALGAWLL